MDEIWSVWQGLSLARDMGFKFIFLEIDSITILKIG